MKVLIQLFRLLKSYFLQSYDDRTLTKEKLENWQLRKVERHLDKVWKNSPYYQKAVSYQNRLKLEVYPLMDKAEMMKNLSSLNTQELDGESMMAFALQSEKEREFDLLYEDKFTVGLSTGTSGHRGLFVASETESAEWAGRMLSKVLPNAIWKSSKIALFLRANSSLYEETGKQKLQFHWFDLFKSFDENFENLIDLQPDIIVAPSSVLQQIAEKMRVTGAKLAPQKIIAAAEVLPAETADKLEEFFQQKIHQIYQATEGFLGSSCQHGVIHLNENVIHFEKEYLEGRKNAFIPVITDFRRVTQPIIRYRLNDVLVELAEPCPCGSPYTALEQIIGREDDLIILSDSNSKPVTVYPDLLCRLIVCNSEQVEDYRIKFNGSEFEIQLSSMDTDNQSRIKQALINYLQGIDIEIPQIKFTKFEAHRCGDKMRRVINLKQR